MITKILKIQNVGLLQNATQQGPITLGKVTAFYADNGRGKSTLATVLRACQLGDAGRLLARKTLDGQADPEIDFLLPTGAHVKFSANAWTSALPHIAVFDSEFVEQNVYSGIEVRADQRQSLLEFALGDATVKLKQRIDKLTEDISAQTQLRTAAASVLAAQVPQMDATQFIALQPVADAQDQIAGLRKRIEATKNAQALSARQVPNHISEIEFDTSAFFAVLATTISDVEADAEAVVKAHLERHRTSGIEDWVSRGLEHAADSTCPFCGQSVANVQLVRAYQSYFNRAYAELKKRVAALDGLVSKSLAEARLTSILAVITTNAARIDAWKDQLAIQDPPFDREVFLKTLGALRNQLEVLVGAKLSAPLEPVFSAGALDEVANALAQANMAIEAYNSALETVSTAIADFKVQLAAENVVLLEAEIRRLEAAQRRADPEAIAAVAAYQTAEKQRKLLDAEKKATRQSLDELMKDTLAEYQTSINTLLVAFGASFSIVELKPSYVGGGEPRSDYAIGLRSKQVKLGSRSDITTSHGFATTLSEADKRTLAFAFFIARLRASGDLGSKLVVLDDPVSSLDRNRRYQSIKTISTISEACGQLVVLSHDSHFIRELKERLGEMKPTPLSLQVMAIERVGSGYSAFGPCDIDDLCSSDYYRHHRLVSEYVDGGSSGDLRDVAKAIRPMLEGYYHRRFPGRIPRRLMFGQVIAKAAQAAPGDVLAHLGPVLKDMRDVNEYAAQFHHDTNPGFETAPVVDTELLQFARLALTLMYQNG